MITPFSFFTTGELLFGRNQRQHASGWLSHRARRVLLVQGANPQRADWLAQALAAAGVQVGRFSVGMEPPLALIAGGVALARQQKIEAVVSLGGGAVIDAGKAIAALTPQPGELINYLEIVGDGRAFVQDPLPFAALPTTAGTGAEVTKNAVISVPEQQRKVSLRDNRMLANLAIIDPDLMDNAPRQVTLYAGLDALTQVIEPYICNRANPLTDTLCRDAIGRGLQALTRLMRQECPHSRDEMAWVSLCGGLALANAGLGVVHGLAGPLGGLSQAAHGAICGILLPFCLSLNQSFADDPYSIGRLNQVIEWIGHAFDVPPSQACDALYRWSRKNGLPPLAHIATPAMLNTAAQMALNSSSIKANPTPLTSRQLLAMLQQCWQAA